MGMEDFNGHYSNSEEIRRMGFSQGGYSSNGSAGEGSNGGGNGHLHNGMQSMSSSENNLPWRKDTGKTNVFEHGKTPIHRTISSSTREPLRSDGLVQEISKIDGYDITNRMVKDAISSWKSGTESTDNVSKAIGDFLFDYVLNSNLPEREKLALTSFFINED